MSGFLNQLIDMLQRMAESVPVELFIFLGAFIEELIAPIPSPIVMTLGGSIALAQNRPFIFLFVLALIGAIGKTIGAYLLYIIADKLEDVVVGKFGRFFGISHKEIERLGKHFNGGLRDDIIIFLARAIPVVPTAPVSLLCGVIKVRMKTYLLASFLGTLPRNLFYLYLGYAGLASVETILEKFDSVETVVTILLVLIVGGGFAVIWYAKNKDAIVEKLQGLLEKKTSK